MSSVAPSIASSAAAAATDNSINPSQKPAKAGKRSITSADPKGYGHGGGSSTDVNTSKSTKKYSGEKAIPRCTSPSHFLSVERSMYGPEHTKNLPDRSRIDSLLSSVASIYYHKSQTAVTALGLQNQLWVPLEYDKLEYSTLDQLCNPLRKPNPLDSWSPKEIALFEAAICAVGKEFHDIARIIGTKKTSEVIDFYYIWKKSSHYAMWKHYGKPNRPPHSGKAQQIAAIQQRMGQAPDTDQQSALKHPNATAQPTPSAANNVPSIVTSSAANTTNTEASPLSSSPSPSPQNASSAAVSDAESNSSTTAGNKRNRGRAGTNGTANAKRTKTADET